MNYQWQCNNIRHCSSTPNVCITIKKDIIHIKLFFFFFINLQAQSRIPKNATLNTHQTVRCLCLRCQACWWQHKYSCHSRPRRRWKKLALKAVHCLQSRYRQSHWRFWWREKNERFEIILFFFPPLSAHDIRVSLNVFNFQPQEHSWTESHASHSAIHKRRHSRNGRGKNDSSLACLVNMILPPYASRWNRNVNLTPCGGRTFCRLGTTRNLPVARRPPRTAERLADPGSHPRLCPRTQLEHLKTQTHIQRHKHTNAYTHTQTCKHTHIGHSAHGY